MNLDLTLDGMKVPAIDGYTPPFGTKITRTDINRGGLSTREVTENVLMPFARMRPTVVTEDSSTGDIEYDAKIIFSPDLESGATLTLGEGAYPGCELTLRNMSSYACTAERSAWSATVPAGSSVKLEWNGNSWDTVTDGTVSSGSVKPVESGAVALSVNAGALATVSGAAVTATIPGFVLREGAVVRLLCPQMDSSNPTLNVNGTGAYPIKSARNGALVNITRKNGYWGDSQTSSYRTWDDNTTLEVIYTDGSWVVIGNPVLLSYYSLEKNYLVHANGYIEQFGYVDFSENLYELTYRADFFVEYAGYNFSMAVMPMTSGQTTSTAFTMTVGTYSTSKSGANIVIRGKTNADKARYIKWMASGF